MQDRSTTIGGTLALCAALAFAAPAWADEAFGEVASLVGDAELVAPGASPRAIELGDAVPAGATLRTGSGSSVGVLTGEVLTQLDADSEARVSRTSGGSARVDVEKGHVRIIDAREGGEPVVVASLGAQAVVSGGDAEVHVLEEKPGRYAMFCEWDSPLTVTRGPQRAAADPGDCVIANEREPLFVAPGHDPRIPALAGSPPVNTGPGVDPTNLFDTGPDSLPDVAAGPPPGDPGADPGPGGPAFDPSRSPCDDPGSGCGAFAAVGPGGGVHEQPPTTTPFPGGGGGFPGQQP